MRKSAGGGGSGRNFPGEFLFSPFYVKSGDLKTCTTNWMNIIKLIYGQLWRNLIFLEAEVMVRAARG
jgi:hypothetical protein